MKTKFWVFIIGGILLLSAALSILLLQDGQADFAEVYSDGTLIYTLDLRINQEKTVEGEYGTNVITVKNGAVAVTYADCPDGYCKKRGFCQGGTEIVCLPNRLIVRFVGEQTVDAAAG